VAKSFGWGLAPREAQGRLMISYTSPVELVTDRFLDEALRQIARIGARRAVIDSLTSMSLGVPSQRRFRELVYALIKHFRAAGVTPVMTMEVAELLGTAQLTGHGVSSIADNLIVLRYVEMAGRLERAVFVLKARGTAHSSEVRRFLIADGGAHVGARFEDLRGVLTGIPQTARAAGRPVSRRSSGKKRRGRCPPPVRAPRTPSGRSPARSTTSRRASTRPSTPSRGSGERSGCSAASCPTATVRSSRCRRLARRGCSSSPTPRRSGKS